MIEETFVRPNYKKDAAVNTIAHIFYLFALWLMTFLTPKIGNFADAGVFTIALSIANICTAISTYNISTFQASDVNKKYKDNHYLYFGLTTTFISFLIAISLCFGFGYLNGPNGVAVFFTIFLYYVFKSAENVSLIFYVSMQRQGKMYLSGYSLLVKAVVMLGIFVGVYAISKSLVLTMGVLAVSAYAYMFLVDFLLVKKHCGNVLKIDKPNFKIAMTLFGAAAAVCIYGFSFAMVPSLPRMIYERLPDVSTDQVGYFGTMAAITVLIQAAVSALLVPFIPKITKSYLDKDFKEFFKVILIFTALIAGLTLVAFLMTAFLGEWALTLFYGESIRPYTGIFKWIVLATGLQTFVILLATVCISMRKKIAVAVVSLLGLIAMISLVYLLVSSFKMMGIVYVYYISYGIMTLGFVGVLIYCLSKQIKQKEVISE